MCGTAHFLRYWGLGDFFLIERGTNAVLIEQHCYYGVPTWQKPNATSD